MIRKHLSLCVFDSKGEARCISYLTMRGNENCTVLGELSFITGSAFYTV